MKSSAIKGLVSLSRRKKVMVSSLVISLILTSVWIHWDTQRVAIVSDYIRNEDARVFGISYFDLETNTSYIKGSHDLTMDVRACHVRGGFLEYTHENNSYPTITGSWNLTYEIRTGFLGSAVLSVEFWLFSPNLRSLWRISVLTIAADGGIESNTTCGTAVAVSGFLCLGTQTYFVAAVIVVELSGISSITGIDSNKPASLHIQNLNVTSG
jgi:hypothetical protein